MDPEFWLSKSFDKGIGYILYQEFSLFKSPRVCEGSQSSSTPLGPPINVDRLERVEFSPAWSWGSLFVIPYVLGFSPPQPSWAGRRRHILLIRGKL
mmetsp:Transcript_10699/g.21519  ORF Transcript_10699/g.21519 Transcript_10699/m.21519 type:complete len:96 (-) Transcript_10699:70-357(-)